MDETIREFGSEAGMPQPTKFIGKEFENIIIWSEYNPIGTQHLTTADRIEELKRTPKVIKSHIVSIILSPFDHPMGSGIFASVCDFPGYIIIYKILESKAEIKRHMREIGTIRHETGHIIDQKIKSISDVKMFSHGEEWNEAKKNDSKIKKNLKTLPVHWVLGNAEDYSKKYSMEWGLQEDFADSVRFFTGNDTMKHLLRKNYPHRYNILKVIFK